MPSIAEEISAMEAEWKSPTDSNKAIDWSLLLQYLNKRMSLAPKRAHNAAFADDDESGDSDHEEEKGAQGEFCKGKERQHHLFGNFF